LWNSSDRWYVIRECVVLDVARLACGGPLHPTDVHRILTERTGAIEVVENCGAQTVVTPIRGPDIVVV